MLSGKIPPWEELPSDLWKDIAKRLTSIADYISFRAVCTCWRSTATFDNFDTKLPRLIHFVQRNILRTRYTKSIDLVSNTYKITNFPPATDYPYLSSSGWILRLSKYSVNVRLMHYIHRENIDLPGLHTFPGYEVRSVHQPVPIIRKMVLSTTPHLLVMVIWGDANQLAFCRHGDESWTVMEKWDDSFSDIIYEDRKLYAVDSRLRVVECSIHGSKPTKIVKVFAFPGVFFLDEISRIRSAGRYCVVHNYLVKSSGKFLIVSRYIRYEATYQFRIYEIELKGGSYVEVRNLGRRCLFLGLNSSICGEFPVSSLMKLRRDCIYYTNTIQQCSSLDTGVCRLSDGDCKDLFLGLDYCFPQPTMVVPTLDSMLRP